MDEEIKSLIKGMSWLIVLSTICLIAVLCTVKALGGTL
jgi:hypothetical protein